MYGSLHVPFVHVRCRLVIPGQSTAPFIHTAQRSPPQPSSQGEAVPHCPFMPQVCAPVTPHRLAPGAHALHAPSVHPFGHSVVMPHWSSSLQARRPDPMHSVAPDAQAAQRFPPQPRLPQDVPIPQVPSALQVCCIELAQRIVPGTHSVQRPAAHEGGEHMVCGSHCPLTLHVRVWVLPSRHSERPGVHALHV